MEGGEEMAQNLRDQVRDKLRIGALRIEDLDFSDLRVLEAVEEALREMYPDLDLSQDFGEALL